MKAFGLRHFLIAGSFFALCGANAALALTQWEVAILFLGSQENAEYQKDIDRNILELSRTHPNDYYRLSIYRELPKTNVEYFVDRKSKKLQPWDALFDTKPSVSIQVPGEMREWTRRPNEANLLLEPIGLSRFFEGAFANPSAKRILIIYSHGLGYDGLGHGVTLKILRKSLEKHLPKRRGRLLDILWLDACFMANVETAYELRNTSRILVASEEAEFSAGAPFDMLHSLSWGPDYSYGVALDLAQRFIESYSYIKNGSQKQSVYKSSATVSVIDLRRVEDLASRMKDLALAIGKLSSIQRKELKRYVKQLTMDKSDLIDLGALVVFLSKSETFQDVKTKEAITQIRFLLDLQRPEKFQTNPRLLIQPSTTQARLGFGYEQWTKGFRGDRDTLEKIPDLLKENITGFYPGYAQKEWPYREVKDVLYFSPFSVGLNQFHYHFLSESTLQPDSTVSSFERTKDFVYFPGETATNPILFTGYTQGIGENAERYSGLSILDPTVGLPSFDYPELDFAQLTGWGNL